MATSRTLRDLFRVLKEMRVDIERLHGRLEVISEQLSQRHGRNRLNTSLQRTSPDALDVMTLLSLPDHLRKTATAVSSLGETTAEEVARETGRVRALESGYLNQLERMGHFKKRKRGRKTYFSIENRS